ncbi:LIP-domain-containing protein [Hyaloscypha variabilis F]|uniref:LIP-domain-containing protein n=1 Tax=Hyaloscypha variabilis (strain UAMH 11265 / GT02V1 / F) TaxID=1149755 RepID=A0A2J6RQX1_HYAVF|nr:LIP-domain-containing protein [Hyaloscypha variabilis F]
MVRLAPQPFPAQLIGGASRTPRTRLPLQTTPIPPSEDPFYQPPAGYETAAPGAILASRLTPSTLSAFQTFPLSIKAAYQLLYRTTNSLGGPEVTVTTVLIPYSADTTKLISYQIAEDATYINCAPSYVLQTGSNTTYAGTGSLEVLLITAALNQGWIVNVPDWEGPNSTFIAGIQAGQATLDSVRAALASGDITGVSSKAQVQMWGYSGGALASEFAAELQANYAPEINFVGTAIGGTTPNITNVYNTINNGLFAGLNTAGILSLAKAYPDFNTYLQSVLVPSKAAAFDAANERCFYADVVDYAYQNIDTYFTNGAAFFNDSVVVSILTSGATMGLHGTPSMPLLVYKAVADEISPIADTDALVAKLCSQGTKITYIRDYFGEHFIQAATSVGAVIDFFKDNFNGVSPTECTTQDVYLDALLDPAVTLTLGASYVAALLDIIGVPIGIGHF